ncbi:MAG: twin-arginine translocase subunit TatC [Fimbriimonadaceae bacterium]
MPVDTKRSWKRKKRNSSGDPEEFRATLGEHLEELRDRLIKCALFIMLGWIAGWFLQPYVYEFVDGYIKANWKPPKDVDIKEVFGHVSEPFMLKLKLSFMIGLAFAIPILIWQLWQFVAPGLREKERKPFKIVLPASLFLFALGAYFCWLIIPAALNFFLLYLEDFKGAALYQDVGTLVFFVLKMMLAFGVGFQLPLVVFILGKVGIIGPDVMIRYWRQATIAIFLLSAVLTPSQDIFSMMMMAVPLSLLFALSVFAVRFTTRRGVSSVPELNDLD